MNQFVFYILIYILIILFLWHTKWEKNLFSNKVSKIFSLTSTILLTFCGVLYSSDSAIILGETTWKDGGIFILLISILVYIISFIIEIHENKNYTLIETEKNELIKCRNKLKFDLDNLIKKHSDLNEDYYSLASNILKDTFQTNFFDYTNNNGRISLYKHENDNFVLVGRFSNNPDFNDKGRGTYSNKEGFIYLGWTNKEFKIYDIPEYNNKGIEYITYVRERCNISAKNLNGISMRSRSYYIYRFDNNDARKPLGIIVFETAHEAEIDTSLFMNLLENNNIIIYLLKGLKNLN